MTPTEFLRQRNIVANNKSDLIIGFDNGTEESLVELLESYHKSKLKLLAIPDVSNILPTCTNCGNKMKIYAYECKCGMTKLAE